MIAGIHISQETFAVDVLRALKSSLGHCRKHVLRLLQLYGDQALTVISPAGRPHISCPCICVHVCVRSIAGQDAGNAAGKCTGKEISLFRAESAEVASFSDYHA